MPTRRPGRTEPLPSLLKQLHDSGLGSPQVPLNGLKERLGAGFGQERQLI